LTAKVCFVISPIGDEGTDIRRRSDQVLKHIIQPAAKECGYETVRADKISEPGIITSQIIQHLVEDPIVVADLAGRNPNVFYELAIRHAIRKPVLQLGKMGETIPFDVAPTRTIYIDHQDLDSANAARERLVEQIRSVEKNPKDVDNPISIAIDVQALRTSGNPLEKSHAQIVAQLQEIKGMLETQGNFAWEAARKTDAGYREMLADLDHYFRREREWSQPTTLSAEEKRAINRLHNKLLHDTSMAQREKAQK
jgi:hypothetical protein